MWMEQISAKTSAVVHHLMLFYKSLLIWYEFCRSNSSNHIDWRQTDTVLAASITEEWTTCLHFPHLFKATTQNLLPCSWWHQLVSTSMPLAMRWLSKTRYYSKNCNSNNNPIYKSVIVLSDRHSSISGSGSIPNSQNHVSVWRISPLLAAPECEEQQQLLIGRRRKQLR